MQVQKRSPDIVKLVITETADERPSADADDGFAATESELAVFAGEAAAARSQQSRGSREAQSAFRDQAAQCLGV